LHHIIGILVDLPSLACPNDNPFWGAGAELVDMHIPDGYLFPLAAGERVVYLIDLMNHDHHGARNITVVQYMDYYILDGTESFKPVEIYLISVLGCFQDLDYEVPVGPVGQKYISYLDFPSNVQGHIVWFQGHLHMGGQDVYLMNTQTAEVYYNSLPTYDKNGYLIDMSGGSPMNLITFGAPMRLVAIYEQGPDPVDAMGVMIGFIHVEKASMKNEEEYLGTGNPNQSQSSGSHFFGSLILIAVGVFLGVAGVLLVIGGIVGFRLYRLKKMQSDGRHSISQDDDL